MNTDRYFFKDIPLVIPNKYNPLKNSYTIFIGNNGVGKSRLLNSLSRARIEEHTSPQIFLDQHKNLIWGFKSNELSDGLIPIHLNKSTLLPTAYFEETSDLPKIIAVSTSPFDSFKLPSKNSERKNIHRSNYRYIGMRGSSVNSSASISLINSAASGLIEKLAHRENFERLAKVFEVLEFHPSIEFAFKPMYKHLEPTDVYEESRQVNLMDFMHNERIDEIEKNLKIKSDSKTHATLRVLSDETLQEINIAIGTINSHLPNRSYLKLKAIYQQQWNYQFDGEYENNHFILNAIQILLKYDLIKLMDLRLSKPSNREMSLRRASSGEQCMLVIMLGIAGHITDKSSIFIDEPEISLHPKWQEKFMSLLIEVFSTYSGCSFYIATHSPQIISKLIEENCFITSLAKKEIYDASDYKDRSADFQLAELFDAPGSMNEYLIRMAFGLISRIKASKKVTDKDFQEIEKLKKMANKLEANDPLLELITTVFEMNEYYASNK